MWILCVVLTSVSMYNLHDVVHVDKLFVTRISEAESNWE